LRAFIICSIVGEDGSAGFLFIVGGKQTPTMAMILLSNTASIG
jgi:hypothetical protein